MISDVNIKIDRDLCFACGSCVDRCIMDNLRLSVAPCRQACPLDLNCQGYVRLTAQGKEAEAAEELRKYTPFAGILGRICSRPCESACEREASLGDGAVTIRSIKRFLADNYPDICSAPSPVAKQSGRRTAVVGSGPAGLSAAYELAALGHRVIVYEASDRLGGMLEQVIPAFRMPQAEIDKSLKMLREMGVEFKTGVTLGQDIQLDELEESFDAVVLAMGASRPLKLGVPGEELAGVASGLSFLASARRGVAANLSGTRVAVIGGGNTAVDCAVVSRKLGASSVQIVCLENPREMPAHPDELDEAVEEGVEIRNGWAVDRIEKGEGQTLTLQLARCLSAYDSKGLFAPMLEKPGVSLALNVDLVLVAIGQGLSQGAVNPEMVDAQTRFLSCEQETLKLRARERVFACGDCVSGPSSVVEAMAAGREAATSANLAILGQDPLYNRDRYQVRGMIREYLPLPERGKGTAPRCDSKPIPRAQRTLEREWADTMGAEEARREAGRCLSCGRSVEQNKTCWYCLPCEIECPAEALYVRMPYQVR